MPRHKRHHTWRYREVYEKITQDKTLFPMEGLPENIGAQWILLLAKAHDRFYSMRDIFYVGSGGSDPQTTGSVLKQLYDTGKILDKLKNATDRTHGPADDLPKIRKMLAFLYQGFAILAGGPPPPPGYTRHRHDDDSDSDSDNDSDSDAESDSDLSDSACDFLSRRRTLVREAKRYVVADYGDGWYVDNMGILFNASHEWAALRWFAFAQPWVYNVYNMRAMDMLMDFAIEEAANQHPKIRQWMDEFVAESASSSSSSAAAAVAPAPMVQKNIAVTQR